MVEVGVGMPANKPPPPRQRRRNAAAGKRKPVAAGIHLCQHVTLQAFAQRGERALDQRTQVWELQDHALHRAGGQLIQVQREPGQRPGAMVALDVGV